MSNTTKKVFEDLISLYDIADDCGKNYTLKHFMERIKIYNEEEFDYDIKTFNLDQ